MVTWMSAWVGWTSPEAWAAPPAPLRCGTAERLRDAPPARRGLVLSAGGARGQRDVYDLPNVRTSTHFAVRWGDGNPPPLAQVDALLDHFELAWDVEVVELDHEPPYGSDAFLFNVYVGDSGSGAPSSYGAGGYQTVDAEGWPMIVVARSSFVDPSFLQHTAVHEFYHAIQSQTGRFPYDGIAAWYWEATAEWAAIHAVPDNPSNGVFAPGYVWLPELGVPAFDYPDEGTLEEYHQYGAFLFPYDLSRAVGPEVVTGTWKDAGRDPDPMSVMARTVADAGLDFDELWLDHAAHAVLLDSPLQDVLAPHFETFSFSYPGEDVLTRGLSGTGGDGKLGAEAPRRYGHAVIVLRAPPAGVLHVAIDGEAAGTEGSPAVFGGRVVVDAPGGPTYAELPFAGTEGRLDLEVDGDDVYVVVGATTPDAARWDDERFPFAYDLWVEETPDDAPTPRRPRGRVLQQACDTSGGAGPGLVGVVAGALGAWRARRRRPTG